jgi:hypothetical protein
MSFSLNRFNRARSVRGATTATGSASSGGCGSLEVCDDGGCGGGGGDALLIDGTNQMLADANIGNNALLNVNLTEFNELGSIPTPDPGQISIYANSNDGLMHYVDDAGNDNPIAQPVNLVPPTYGELQAYDTAPTPANTYTLPQAGTLIGFDHLLLGENNNVSYVNLPVGTGDQTFKIDEAGIYRISILIFQDKVTTGGGPRQIDFVANINTTQFTFATGTSETSPSNIAGTVLREFVVGDEFKLLFRNGDGGSDFDVAFLDVNINIQRISERVPADNPFDQSLNTTDNVTFETLQMPILASTTTANTGNLKLYFNEDDEVLRIRTNVDDPSRPDFIMDNGVDYSGVTEAVRLKNSDVTNVKTLTATTLESQSLVNIGTKESFFLLDERCQGPGFQGSPTVIAATIDTINKQITFPAASELAYSFPGFLTTNSVTRIYGSWDQPVYKEELGTVTFTYGLASDVQVVYNVAYSAGVPVYTISTSVSGVNQGTVTLDNPLGYLEMRVVPGGTGSISFIDKIGTLIVNYPFNLTFANNSIFKIVKDGVPLYRVSTLQVSSGSPKTVTFVANENEVAMVAGAGGVAVSEDLVEVETSDLKYTRLLLNDRPWPFSHSFSSFTYTLLPANTTPLAGQLSLNNPTLTSVTQLQMNTFTGRGQTLTFATGLFPLGRVFYITDVNEKSFGYKVTGAPTVASGVLTVACSFFTRTTTAQPATDDIVTLSFAPQGSTTVVAEFEGFTTVPNLGSAPWIIPVTPLNQTIDDIAELTYTQVAIGGATGTVISGFILDKIYSFNTYLPINKQTTGENNTVRLGLQVSTASPPSTVNASNSSIIASGITTIFGDGNTFSGINWSIRVTDFFKCTNVNQKIWFSGEAKGDGTISFGGAGVNACRIEISTNT